MVPIYIVNISDKTELAALLPAIIFLAPGSQLVRGDQRIRMKFTGHLNSHLTSTWKKQYIHYEVIADAKWQKNIQK